MDANGKDINIFIDGMIVAYLAGATGNMHLVQLGSPVVKKLTALGLTIEDNKLAVIY